jgi:hypothetical protein
MPRSQLWKNPVTGALHFQVHPCAIAELHVDPLPESASREGALFPDGARLTDLKEVRDILYRMQRPAIAPSVSFFFPSLSDRNDLQFSHNKLVYPHDW